MDTRQLTTFLMLAQEKNYAKVSQMLNYAPSTLMDHIKTLETELNAKLFDRCGKQSRLTDQGMDFLPYAKKMLALQTDALGALAKDEVERETLRVATAQSLGQYAMTEVFRRFIGEYEDCEMRIEVGNCAEYPQRVAKGELDLAYLYDTQAITAPQFESVALYDEPLYFVVHRAHPLARRESVSLEDFEGQRFAFTIGNCCYTMAFLRMLKRHNVRLGAQDYLGNVEMIKSFTLENFGIALLTDSATRKERAEGSLAALNWSGTPMFAKAQILYTKNRRLTKPMQKLIDWSLEYAKTRQNKA